MKRPLPLQVLIFILGFGFGLVSSFLLPRLREGDSDNQPSSNYNFRSDDEMVGDAVYNQLEQLSLIEASLSSTKDDATKKLLLQLKEQEWAILNQLYSFSALKATSD